jgi:hypothetical protein
MASDQRDQKEGAQQQSPAEREAKKNPANRQDLEKPPEGRDEAPAETVKEGKRSSKSPWLGGG